MSFDPKHVGIMEAMGLSQVSLRAAHAPSNSAVQMAAILDATDQDLRRDVENRQLQQRERTTVPAALLKGFLSSQLGR